MADFLEPRRRGQALGSCATLERVDVSNCGIVGEEPAAGGGGERVANDVARAIAEGAGASGSLRTIRMHWNPLGAGVPVIEEALRHKQECLLRIDHCQFNALEHSLNKVGALPPRLQACPFPLVALSEDVRPFSQPLTPLSTTLHLSQVNGTNPSGHYRFDLSAPFDREQLQVLVALGRQESPPSRTNWTRLVPPSVLSGHVSSAGRSPARTGATSASTRSASPFRPTASGGCARPQHRACAAQHCAVLRFSNPHA